MLRAIIARKRSTNSRQLYCCLRVMKHTHTHVYLRYVLQVLLVLFRVIGVYRCNIIIGVRADVNRELFIWLRARRTIDRFEYDGGRCTDRLIIRSVGRTGRQHRCAS